MFDVVHIGLGKCLSTTLQGIWKGASNVQCVDVAALSPKVTQLLITAQQEGKALPALDFEPPPMLGRDCTVLTSEGMTFSLLVDKPQHFGLIPLRQAYMAKTFGPRARKVLMVVRNPFDWVRSAHAQYIKQGGCASRAAFFDSHRESCLHNLDLVRIVAQWREVNPALEILPMELYASDRAAFWCLYTQRLQVPVPTPDDTRDYQNTSRYDRLELSARVNRVLAELSGILGHVEQSHAKAAREGFVHGRQWGVRRAMENASDAECQALAGAMDFRPDPAFLAWTPDAEFKGFVRERFLPPLRGLPHLADWVGHWEAACLP